MRVQVNGTDNSACVVRSIIHSYQHGVGFGFVLIDHFRGAPTSASLSTDAVRVKLKYVSFSAALALFCTWRARARKMHCQNR